MIKEFSFNKVRTVEFFVCYDTSEGERYWQIPIDANVQGALEGMLKNTAKALAINSNAAWEQFEPAQKYSTVERLEANLEEEHMEKIRNIFSAENIKTNASAMREAQAMAFYFAVFKDNEDRKLMAIRRAAQFKGVIKARNRLVSLIDDTLQLVQDDIFKLDVDFDYLVSSTKIWILRPSGFEFTAEIEDAIASRAITMTEEVATSIPCVDFSKMQDFIGKHRRAARLVASLRSRSDLNLTSPKKLKKGCRSNGIEFVSSGGKIYPATGSEMAFLELLDRRRYIVDLVDASDELYVAGSRRGIARVTPLTVG